MSEIYQKKLDSVIEEFDTSIEEGLSQSEVESIRQEVGENKLKESESKSRWEILLENLNNIIVYLLGAAALVSVFMGDWIEALAILIAVLISVLTGFFAEWNAQESVDSLQEMVTTEIKVLREGKEKEIDSVDLVPGDIMMLEEGDAIPADGRLVETNNFAVMEAALTGESEAVDKDHEAEYESEEAVGDRLNMVFSGTAVTRGKATVIVTGTAMDTEVGKISEMLDEEEDRDTPLEKEIGRLGKALIVVAFAAALLVIAIGLFTGEEIGAILQIAIILAVAAIPEALPAVQTITLSNGMDTMAEQEALVKSLSAVETLGSTSIIASDKTGTLTENQMMVERLVLADDFKYTVTGNGYRPEGKIKFDDQSLDLSIEDPDRVSEAADDEGQEKVLDLIVAGFLSSDAVLEKESDEEEYSITGDPTDGALTVLGHKVGLSPESLENKDYESLAEIPFDSEKKYMAAFYRYPDETSRIIIKGAPDVITELTLTQEEEQNYWEEKNEELAGEGMRVIALASYIVEDSQVEEAESNLEIFLQDHQEDFELLGLYGIMDPPRSDVAESVRLTQEAGIQLKMITGDHPKTASVIAKEIGIEKWEKTMTGQEIDENYESKGFAQEVEETGVFARVSPENKLQIIKALQEDGQVVAMTGDGVNDAPALKGADIGVAMGIRGTEVAKEASDMILTDDRYATIVSAVREGRIIFENIKKYVSFLFSCNMVEIVAVILTLLLLLPLPILPLQILYLNLLVDIGPAIALAYEPAEDDVMKQPPRKKDEGLVNKKFLGRILASGIVIGLGAFGVFYYMTSFTEQSLQYAQTMTFSYMAVAQLMHIFNVRKSRSFGLDKTILDNKLLIGMMILSVILQLAAVYLPFMNNILGTEPLQPLAWLIIFLVGLLVTVLVYTVKRVFYLK